MLNKLGLLKWNNFINQRQKIEKFVSLKAQIIFILYIHYIDNSWLKNVYIYGDCSIDCSK